MYEDDTALSGTASMLITTHGWRAQQHVVDQIVRSIRDHDLSGAKRWDAVGRAVDRLLATEATEQEPVVMECRVVA